MAESVTSRWMSSVGSGAARTLAGNADPGGLAARAPPPTRRAAGSSANHSHLRRIDVPATLRFARAVHDRAAQHVVTGEPLPLSRLGHGTDRDRHLDVARAGARVHATGLTDAGRDARGAGESGDEL